MPDFVVCIRLFFAVFLRTGKIYSISLVKDFKK